MLTAFFCTVICSGGRISTISPSSATKNYLTVGMDDVDNDMF